jgi:hypothetical protein
MNREFIPYQEALALKELGFDEPCLGHYDAKGNYSFRTDSIYGKKDIGAPLFQQAFRWFREKGYENWISHKEEGYQFVIKWQFEHAGGIEALVKINSYEEAELECLRKLINMVKNGN